MAIQLYYNVGSPPCRAVLLAAKAIGIEFELKIVNTFEQEHLKPEFIKINPQHTVPTINDNGFILWESRAIMTYLQNRYGRNDSLYPKDPKKRALVDQRLYFDMDLSHRFHEVFNIKTLSGEAPPDPEKLQNVNKGLDLLETFLDQTEYVAGDTLTLADLALVVQISNLEILEHDISSYKNINRWLAKVKATAPGYKEANEDHLEVIRQLIAKLKSK